MVMSWRLTESEIRSPLWVKVEDPRTWGNSCKYIPKDPSLTRASWGETNERLSHVRPRVVGWGTKVSPSMGGHND